MPLNLKSVGIALVNHVAVAQNIAYETIDPGVSAGHFSQQRLNNRQAFRDFLGKASQIARTTRNLSQALGLYHHDD
jgi:hypothetical protein